MFNTGVENPQDYGMVWTMLSYGKSSIIIIHSDSIFYVKFLFTETPGKIVRVIDNIFVTKSLALSQVALHLVQLVPQY